MTDADRGAEFARAVTLGAQAAADHPTPPGTEAPCTPDLRERIAQALAAGDTGSGAHWVSMSHSTRDLYRRYADHALDGLRQWQKHDAPDPDVARDDEGEHTCHDDHICHTCSCVANERDDDAQSELGDLDRDGDDALRIALAAWKNERAEAARLRSELAALLTDERMAQTATRTDLRIRHNALCDVLKLDHDTDPYDAIDIAEKVHGERDCLSSELAGMTAQRDALQARIDRAVSMCKSSQQIKRIREIRRELEPFPPADDGSEGSRTEIPRGARDMTTDHPSRKDNPDD